MRAIVVIVCCLLSLFSTVSRAEKMSVEVTIDPKVKITVDREAGTVSVKLGDVENQFPASVGGPGQRTAQGCSIPTGVDREYNPKFTGAPAQWVIHSPNFDINSFQDDKNIGKGYTHGNVRLYTQHAKMIFDLVNEQGLQNTLICVN